MADKYIQDKDITRYTASYSTGGKNFTYREQLSSNKKNLVKPSDKYSNSVALRDLYRNTTETGGEQIADGQYFTEGKLANAKLVYDTITATASAPPSGGTALKVFTLSKSGTNISKTFNISLNEMAGALRYLGKKLTFTPVERSFVQFTFGENNEGYPYGCNVYDIKDRSIGATHIGRIKYDNHTVHDDYDDIPLYFNCSYVDSGAADATSVSFNIWMASRVDYTKYSDKCVGSIDDNGVYKVSLRDSSRDTLVIFKFSSGDNTVHLDIELNKNNISKYNYVITTSTSHPTNKTHCQIYQKYLSGGTTGFDGASIRAQVNIQLKKQFKPKLTTL